MSSGRSPPGLWRFPGPDSHSTVLLDGPWNFNLINKNVSHFHFPYFAINPSAMAKNGILCDRVAPIVIRRMLLGGVDTSLGKSSSHCTIDDWPTIAASTATTETTDFTWMNRIMVGIIQKWENIAKFPGKLFPGEQLTSHPQYTITVDWWGQLYLILGNLFGDWH